ncbi:hypothetical protein PACTADRAFT_47404 [Pachysolen tannophilus NRRL Y-2460]|uniref:Sm domain-containing protein n=1 Tax=Pachysolen tannophilus NRRL Y-2460 TaxID=669874 RepID=A0A1E4U0G9_PACTA|nr:hypothetical protein PACTADRAFT_47404 [Pachysolen tannophilus NRRL Y-2460]
MSESIATTSSANSDPSVFLAEIQGEEVIVKLRSGIEYHGLLQSIDGYMNIVLENTQEYSQHELIRKYGDVFIRGNNVMYISAA